MLIPHTRCTHQFIPHTSCTHLRVHYSHAHYHKMHPPLHNMHPHPVLITHTTCTHLLEIMAYYRRWSVRDDPFAFTCTRQASYGWSPAPLIVAFTRTWQTSYGRSPTPLKVCECEYMCAYVCVYEWAGAYVEGRQRECTHVWDVCLFADILILEFKSSAGVLTICRTLRIH